MRRQRGLTKFARKQVHSVVPRNTPGGAREIERTHDPLFLVNAEKDKPVLLVLCRFKRSVSQGRVRAAQRNQYAAVFQDRPAQLVLPSNRKRSMGRFARQPSTSILREPKLIRVVPGKGRARTVASSIVRPEPDAFGVLNRFTRYARVRQPQFFPLVEDDGAAKTKQKCMQHRRPCRIALGAPPAGHSEDIVV